MTAPEVHSSTKAKRAIPPSKAGRSKANPKQPKLSATPAELPKVEAVTRHTKQNRILALLNQRNGATIPEMMQATNWQQHSVRGFLAGTVKKKLGLGLASSKSDGELRRYRLETRRGR